MELNLATEFSDVPGPRSRQEGEWSGEEFRERLLIPKFCEAEQAGEKLIVDLDGGCGYATSFLEEAFGGLARVYSPKRVLEVLEFKSTEEPYLVSDVREYIREARTGARRAS